MVQSCQHLCWLRALKSIPTLPAVLSTLWSLWSQLRCHVLLWLLQQGGQVPRSFSRNSCCNYFWNFVPQGFPEQVAPLLRNFSWFSSAHRKPQNFLAWLRAPLPFWGPSPLPPSISLIYWLVYLFILWPVFLNVSNMHFLYWRVEMVC